MQALSSLWLLSIPCNFPDMARDLKQERYDTGPCRGAGRHLVLHNVGSQEGARWRLSQVHLRSCVQRGADWHARHSSQAQRQVPDAVQ